MSMTAPKCDFKTAIQDCFTKNGWPKDSETALQIHGLCCAVNFLNKPLFWVLPTGYYSRLASCPKEAY